MEFCLSKEHLMLQKACREMVANEIRPRAHEVDETETFPLESIAKLARSGYLGVPFPKEYDGQGADNLAYAMVIEELSKACATTGVIVSAHTSLGAAPIFEHGTAEQKRKFLAPMARGEMLGAFALTESNAGTDAGSQQTTALLEGDHYVLNGSKIFITNAGYADVYIVAAMTDKSKGMRGISLFIIEKGTPGFSFGKKEAKMGIRGSSTRELIFVDCRIPKEHLLGPEGSGYKIAMKTLDGGRIGIAAQALGIAQGAIDQTVAYVKERKQFGKSIASFQNTQFVLADLQTKVDAARLLVYRAASYKGLGKPYATEAAMAKLFASEVAMEATTKAVQLHGGYGYTRDYPVERMMRDAKITEIYEGTSEVQRMVIAGGMLK